MAVVPPLVPTTDAPLATDSDAAFDAKAFPWAASLNPFGTSVSAIAVSAKENADAALAAALGGDLPAITGQALKLLRVNAGETAAEFAAPDVVIPPLSQLQVEDNTSTVYGQVSGERLAQAFDANEQQIGVGQTWQTPTRAVNTTYQNTTGKPIAVAILYQAVGGGTLEVSTTGAFGGEEVVVGYSSAGNILNVYAVIPDTHYYRSSGGSINTGQWKELR